MAICPTCEEEAKDPIVMRDWIWVRQGNDGFWFCRWDCLARYAANKPLIVTTTTSVESYQPTPEEERRMSE